MWYMHTQFCLIDSEQLEICTVAAQQWVRLVTRTRWRQNRSHFLHPCLNLTTSFSASRPIRIFLSCYGNKCFANMLLWMYALIPIQDVPDKNKQVRTLGPWLCCMRAFSWLTSFGWFSSAISVGDLCWCVLVNLFCKVLFATIFQNFGDRDWCQWLHWHKGDSCKQPVQLQKKGSFELHLGSGAIGDGDSWNHTAPLRSTHMCSWPHNMHICSHTQQSIDSSTGLSRYVQWSKLQAAKAPSIWQMTSAQDHSAVFQIQDCLRTPNYIWDTHTVWFPIDVWTPGTFRHLLPIWFKRRLLASQNCVSFRVSIWFERSSPKYHRST